MNPETRARVDEVEAVFSKRDRCTARPWRSCSRPDGTPLRAWGLDFTWTGYVGGQQCDGGAP